MDILINNAGIQFVSPIEEFPIEKWDQIIAINLSAAFHAMRAAIPGMKARKWGRIISTASAHSLVASPFKSAYVTAKHGLAGLTKTAALETATFGITVNAISPGYVWTPLVERQIPETMAARGLTRDQVIKDVMLGAQPTKQFVTSEQVAAIVVFLCSDAASQITGANLSWTGAGRRHSKRATAVGASQPIRHCEQSEAAQTGALQLRLSLESFVARAPRNDGGGPLTVVRGPLVLADAGR